MIQSGRFTSATFEAFAEAIYIFQYLPRQNKKIIIKKNVEAIKLLGILKYVSRNKIYFCLKKKSIALLNKKVIFEFHTTFKLDFITQIIYCFIHRFLYSLFMLFCSLISWSKKQNTETMLTFPYPYTWKKFNNKMNEKRSQEYQSMDPEYVTRQINSSFLELLLRQFCRLIYAPSQKSQYDLV